jgi:hypothetical protein
MQFSVMRSGGANARVPAVRVAITKLFTYFCAPSSDEESLSLSESSPSLPSQASLIKLSAFGKMLGLI